MVSKKFKTVSKQKQVSKVKSRSITRAKGNERYWLVNMERTESIRGSYPEKDKKEVEAKLLYYKSIAKDSGYKPEDFVVVTAKNKSEMLEKLKTDSPQGIKHNKELARKIKKSEKLIEIYEKEYLDDLAVSIMKRNYRDDLSSHRYWVSRNYSILDELIDDSEYWLTIDKNKKAIEALDQKSAKALERGTIENKILAKETKKYKQLRAEKFKR